MLRLPPVWFLLFFGVVLLFELIPVLFSVDHWPLSSRSLYAHAFSPEAVRVAHGTYVSRYGHSKARVVFYHARSDRDLVLRKMMASQAGRWSVENRDVSIQDLKIYRFDKVDGRFSLVEDRMDQP